MRLWLHASWLASICWTEGCHEGSGFGLSGWLSAEGHNDAIASSRIQSSFLWNMFGGFTTSRSKETLLESHNSSESKSLSSAATNLLESAAGLEANASAEPLDSGRHRSEAPPSLQTWRKGNLVKRQETTKSRTASTRAIEFKTNIQAELDTLFGNDHFPVVHPHLFTCVCDWICATLGKEDSLRLTPAPLLKDVTRHLWYTYKVPTAPSTGSMRTSWIFLKAAIQTAGLWYYGLKRSWSSQLRPGNKSRSMHVFDRAIGLVNISAYTF
eukprot:1177001-Prorocentrum_minimum.AAC.3